MSETVVFVKQTGEALADSSRKLTDDDAIASAAKGLAAAHEVAQQHQARGLVVVSGAGNLCRGASSRFPRADARGRLATIMNTLALVDGLEELGVPVTPMVAPGMEYGDKVSGVTFEPFSPEAIGKAHDLGNLALLGGGMGRNNETTDSAVVRAAAAYRGVYDARAVVLKTTTYDGVYDADPRVETNPPHYQTISAAFMDQNYHRFGVVDRNCLQVMRDAGLEMRIYAGSQYPLAEVVQAELDTQHAHTIGTRVLPFEIEPTFYETAA